MHEHRTDPAELSALLPRFVGGEFILIKGRGRDAIVYNGKSDSIAIPDLTVRRIILNASMIKERWTGCKADFSDERKWRPVNASSDSFIIEYTWYYQQQKHERLKLQSLANDERWWLCSSSDPIYLQRFREILLDMAVKESTRKESLFKRLRNRLFK